MEKKEVIHVCFRIAVSMSLTPAALTEVFVRPVVFVVLSLDTVSSILYYFVNIDACASEP